MDKNNYNVDDILAEIKRKKSGRAQAHSQAPGRQPHLDAPVGPSARPEEGTCDLPVDDFATTSFQPVRQEPAEPPAAPVRRAPPAEREAPPPQPFKVTIPESEEERAALGSKNPLDFEGHARSLSDKARIRREHSLRLRQQPAETPPPSVDFSAPPPPEQAARPPRVLDFSAFRAGRDAEEPPPAPQAQSRDDRTRVLPRLDLERSREFGLEEIKQIDFGAVADEYYDYDEEEEEEAFVPSVPPLDHGEYNSVADRSVVARDIANVKLWLVLRCVFTAVLTGLLYYVCLAGRDQSMLLPDLIVPELSVSRYMLSIVVLGVLVAVVGSSTVGGGLISLFKMRANSDTLVALAMLAAIGQGVFGALKPEAIDPAGLGIYACVASLAMLFNALGKTTMISRIQANFRIISSKEPKRAVLAVQSDEFSRHFVRDTSRRPTIAYSAKAGFFTDFLGLSYSDKYDVGIHRGVAPAILGVTLFVCIMTYTFTGDSAAAITALTALLCVSATLSSTFIENIPLGKLTKRLAPMGGMVSGNKSVEDFCDTRAIVLRELDLFPAGGIQLHGIKAYSHGRVDEAILDAASVISATESALAPVFLQMIGGNKKLLKKVDSLVYESGMGISAWVNARRVLIGNRDLMRNHGISIPADGYDAKYAQEHGEPIYLSNSGEVSAQFVVSYHMDQDLADALDALGAQDKELIVHTVDPNITPHKIWELYGYAEDLIHIMPAELHAFYEQMSAPRDTAIAEIAYTGKAAVMVRAIVACIQARASILAATVIQLVQMMLGYGFIVLVAFLGSMSAVNVVQMSLYQLLWFAAIFVVQKARGS